MLRASSQAWRQPAATKTQNPKTSTSTVCGHPVPPPPPISLPTHVARVAPFTILLSQKLPPSFMCCLVCRVRRAGKKTYAQPFSRLIVTHTPCLARSPRKSYTHTPYRARSRAKPYAHTIRLPYITRKITTPSGNFQEFFSKRRERKCRAMHTSTERSRPRASQSHHFSILYGVPFVLENKSARSEKNRCVCVSPLFRENSARK